MDLIDQFIARYRKEYDFYDQAARLAAQLLEQALQSAGIRAIVTSRAKSLTRLEEKVRQRNGSKKYQSVDAIFVDIVDLAGVRVALYFPGERDQAGKIVTQLLGLDSEPKSFPDRTKPSAYEKRFSGYGATHYRARLREAALNETQKRYGQALIEIQVASVLMHAWAEVEHDLVYKPRQGALSESEYAILDQINGLVMSGEIALEQLQRAVKQRVAEEHRRFTSHYDLADYLLDQVGQLIRTADPDQSLGRVDTLYKFLDQIETVTPGAIKPYLNALSSDFERRSLSDQIIDQLLAEEADRYEVYKRIRDAESGETQRRTDQTSEGASQSAQAMGQFMSLWIEFERSIRDLTSKDQRPKSWLVPSINVIRHLDLFDERSLVEIERIRRFRNNLVHGVSIPSADEIEEANSVLRAILADMKRTGSIG